jgi:hypothetical protein
MKTQGWNELWYLHPADPLIRLAWFVYGCIEREHLLTAKAVGAHFAPYGLRWDGRPDAAPAPRDRRGADG